MAARSMDVRPSPSELRRLLAYDAETGAFTWLYRPELEGTKAGGWNVRYVWMEAGCIDDDGYRILNIHKSKYPAHVIGWVMVKGEWPAENIDHKNMVKSDNRLDNLREATVAQNGWNVGLTKRNKSGHKGVSWHKASRKWMIHFKANKQHHYYGVHDDFDLAVIIAAEAMEKHHGQFVRTA